VAKVENHFVFRSLLGSADECGDTGVIKSGDRQCLLGLVDALGHGRKAHDTAMLARDYIERNFRENLVPLMEGMHEALKGSAGAVASLCRLDIDTGRLVHTGIGNITVKVLGARPLTMVSRDGIIGFQIPSPRKQETTLIPGDVLIMHSDGIRENISQLEMMSLLNGTAKEIAARLLEKFGKKDDDASCIILRVLK